MTHTLNRLLVLALAATAVVACDEVDSPEIAYSQTDDDPSIFGAQAKADGLSLAEGSAEADGVLRVANELSLDDLDTVVKLDARAAKNIVAERDAHGAFDSLRQLDDVSYVGTRAITRMRVYAESQGWIEGGNEAPDAPSVHNIAEGSIDAQTILAVANEVAFEILDDEVKLDSRAAGGIEDGRPFADLKTLDDVSYVGATAFARLLNYGRESGFVPVDAPDGVHGVIEGSDVATAMLCVANNAPLTVLDDVISLDSRAANAIVEARMGDDILNLAALDGVPYVGATAFERLHNWAANNECDFADDVEPSPNAVIFTGNETCTGSNPRYGYYVISNPPLAETDVRIAMRHSTNSPYGPTSHRLEVETGPNVWSEVFRTMPAGSSFVNETFVVPAATVNAGINAMGWLRLRAVSATSYRSCTQVDVTYNCPECFACPEGQEDSGFGCQDIGAPFDQTLLEHSQGQCGRNSATLSFRNAPAPGADGRLTLQYLPCEGGSISVSIETQTAGWVDVGVDTTSRSCGFESASWDVPEAYLASARQDGGPINIRYTINDSCRPGMGCANANDPCVRNVNLSYEQ